MAVTLRPHQKTALSKLSNGKVLCGGVGTGKSIVSIAYYWTRICGGTITPFVMGEHVPLYIITTARKRDSLEWQGDLAMFGIQPGLEGIHIIIDSWQSIKKYVDVKDAFFIFDEQRLVGAGAWVKSFLKIVRHNRWILLSATPGDTWMDYVPLFIAHGFFRNRSEFLREHVVFSRFTKYPKVDRYIVTDKLERLRSRILVDMPYERHTTRKRIDIPVGYNRADYDYVRKFRRDVETREPFQDAGGLWTALRRITNTGSDRLLFAEELARRYERLIVFYNYDYELEQLRTLSGKLDGWDIAEWNGHKHEEVPASKKWVYLVQYMAGAEAWNCTRTDAMLFWSLNYSYRLMEQAEGRIDRMNTPYTTLRYFRFVSDSVVDKAISKAITEKRVFNERVEADLLWGKFA